MCKKYSNSAKELIMGYQLTAILQKCEPIDADFIVSAIDSYINFSDDKGLKECLHSWKSGPMNLQFAQKLETEIRYIASSDIAYAYRKAKGITPAGVDIDEIINDIAKVLKLKIKLGPIESRLEALVRGIFEKRLFEMKPEQQVEMLRKWNVDEKTIKDIQEKIKNNQLIILPILIQTVGPKVTAEIVKVVTISVITQFVGKQAAEAMLKQAVIRFPWIAQFLGPIVWGASLAWLAIDLCGPALRKIIPIMLSLGLVALRDGSEEGDAFWTEAN